MSKNQNALSDLNGVISKPSDWMLEAFSVARSEGCVRVNNCDIKYYQWGDSSKPGIVMMHGFLAHSRCWAFIAPYLSHNYHVVAFDFSGMGDSGWHTEYDDELRISELLAVCTETGLFKNNKKPVVIAHSYGARIAYEAVQAHSDKFNGLIMCDLMIIRPTDAKDDSKRISAPGKRTPNKPNRIYPDYQSAKQRFVLAPRQTVEQAELFDFMAFHSLKEVTGGWQWKFDPRVFRRTGQPEDRWAKAATEVVKTPGRKAFIYGAESKLFTADSVNYIHELIDDLDERSFPLIEIPRAKHHLMLDQPIAVITSLRSILSVWEH